MEEPPLLYTKPSIIQAQAIPNIMKDDRKENFLFQAMNGSGKTGAFAVPALMTVDPTIDDYQVIIIAHSRELIIQIGEILKILAKDSNVTVSIGDKTQKSS